MTKTTSAKRWFIGPAVIAALAAGMGIAMLLTSCGGSSNKGAASPSAGGPTGGGTSPVVATSGTSGSQTAAPGTQTAASFSDPWAYCKAVGTIDKADARYTGPQNTPDMIKGFAKAAGLKDSSPLASGVNPGPALVWRCANGELMVCSFGANIPCDSKANTSSQPTDAMNQYCASPPPNVDPSKPFDMPAVATGHDTIYQWQCQGGKAVAVRQIFQVDAQGYIASFWYQVPPVN